MTPAYFPSEPRVVAVFVAILVATGAGGHAVASRCSARTARRVTWPAFVVGTVAVERLVAEEPPGVRMAALIAFALLVMKVLVVVEERARGMAALPFGTWLAFAGAWLGMKPRCFAARERAPLAGGVGLIRRGAAYAAAGALLVVLARLAWTAAHSRLLATLLLLPGLSLLLHFGLCNALAGAWRLRGVACDALFRAPLLSENLGEFWARRWNLGFSEMTAIAVYRPLAERLGRSRALMAGFALSGLLHEMAISVPVRAGFGLPLLYFFLHGALVWLERRLSDAGHPLKGRGGRAWALFWLAAPLPLLFHRPFLAGVIWPLVGIPAD